MKVLLINTVCGITSTGRICTDLARLLSKQGHICKIAYARGEVPEQHIRYALKIGNDTDVRLHALGSRLFDNTGFYSKRATAEFIEKIKEFDPDIIHLHNIHGYYLNLPLLFSYLKSAGKPVIWTLHDCWAYTGHCAYYDRIGCFKWKNGCGDCPQKKSYPASLFADNSANNYIRKKDLFCSVPEMMLVTPSKWLAGQVKESFLNKYPLRVMPNGIDCTVFYRRKSEVMRRYVSENKKIVLGVANIWSENKGLDDMLKLSEYLPENYQVILVGDLKGRKIPDGITHIAHTQSADELAEIYSAADVFVNPTYDDNFPTTNLESLACGTPVITYNTGGSPEALTELCGRVVPKGDTKALKNAVLEADFDISECEKQGEKFDKEKCFEKYINLYEEWCR